MTKQEFIEKWYPNKAQFTIDLESIRADQPDKPTEWIAVSEILPEYEDWVLLYDGDSHYVGRRMDDYEGFYDYENAEVYGVTHWQPLPTPPQKQKQ